MAWAKEIKAEVKALLEDETPVYRVSEILKDRDGTDISGGTITRWASVWGIPCTGKRGPPRIKPETPETVQDETKQSDPETVTTETTPPATKQPARITSSKKKRRTRPNAVPAELLSHDVREDLRAAVRNTTSRISKDDIAPKDMDALTRALRSILEMTPDLLTYEDVLDPKEATDGPGQRRGHLLRLVRDRGLDGDDGRVSEEPGGTDTAAGD